MARILIADDEQPVRDLLARALKLDGHEIETAPDGAAALDILGADGPFDLLLTDIRMPVMDGVALALSASRDHPELVIVLMTGYAGEKERAQGLNALVHDVILKPFTLPEIKEKLKGALETRKARPAFA